MFRAYIGIFRAYIRILGLISVVCTLISVVCSLISVVCTLISIVCTLISVVCTVISVVCTLISVVCTLISVVCTHTAATTTTINDDKKIYECVFFVPLSLIMWGFRGHLSTPNWSRNAWKLILELGRKWSRGGPKVVWEWWFLVLNQNHIVPTGTCLSATIMIICKNHDPLPTS